MLESVEMTPEMLKLLEEIKQEEQNKGTLQENSLYSLFCLW